MKVCFIVGTLGRGGAERQLVYMLRALKHQGVELKVICLTSGEAFESDLRELGIDVDFVGSSGSRVVRLFRILSLVRQFEPDILQSSHFYTNIYAAVTGMILRIRSIGAVRNDLTSEIGSDPVFGSWQFHLPGHLIANSELAQRRAISLGRKPERIDLVRNIVDVPAGKLTNVKHGRCGVTVLFVGRLQEQKRPELFIRLAAQLIQRHPELNLKFRVVGDGPLRRRLELNCEEMRLPQSALTFAGELSDVEEIYRDSDVLVLTSRYEGTPNVILEAMSREIPVVAMNVGGVPELLSCEGGILVDPSDFKDLLNSTAELILDPELRKKIGRNGKRWVEDHHSLKDLGGSLLEIYRRILKTR